MSEIQNQNTGAYYTIKQAAEAKNIPYWKLSRVCRAGLIPTYTLGNSRLYVRLEEIDAALQKHVGELSAEQIRSLNLLNVHAR